MRQGVYAGNRQAEVGIIFVGQAQSYRFDSKTEPGWITAEGICVRGNLQSGNLLRREDRLVHSARLEALANELDRLAERYDGEDFHGLREKRTPDDVVGFESSRIHTTIASLPCENSHVQIRPLCPEMVIAYLVGNMR
jgi:hypothetical protein